MKPALEKAYSLGYAVGAFNVFDENSSRAVIDRAEELLSPVIIQTSVKTVRYYGAAPIAAWVKAIAMNCKVPVSLHLDHCRDKDLVIECAESGWTDVMFDGADLEFEKNMAITGEIAGIVHKMGVNIEGELGAISGTEDEIFSKNTILTDPLQAQRFVKETGIDYLAPAIGTAHGFYTGIPELHYNNVTEIAKITGIPIVIHGGTGLSENQYRGLIESGGCKINISTHMKQVYGRVSKIYFGSKKSQNEPLEPISLIKTEIGNIVGNYIEIFGSANRG
jgi:fructose-bisphosphate aldolase class II